MGIRQIKRVFESARREKRAALIPFITAGDPSLAKTRELVLCLESAGADIVELGVPFSDPLADGPTIQRASERSLEKGTTLSKILECVNRIRNREVSIPIVLMSYYNPILQMGLNSFAKRCIEVGVDGVIIPDFPPEEAGSWVEVGKRHQLATIFLIAPTSPPKRIHKIGRLSRGFVYYVSLTGITGMRDRLEKDIREKVRIVRRYNDLPVCVGFGISKPEHVRRLARDVDGVIVGSALVGLIERYQHRSNLFRKVKEFVHSLKRATYR